MLPILDGNLQCVSLSVEVSDDSLDFPVSIPIQNIAAIAQFQQFGIKLVTIWPWLGMWPHAYDRKKLSWPNSCGWKHEVHSKLNGIETLSKVGKGN
jgi:hypothetical protein